MSSLRSLTCRWWTLVWLVASVACLGSAAWVEKAHADVPKFLHYQGRLTESDGTSLMGEHTVKFRLYDDASGGTTLWEEQHAIRLEPQDNGVFSVLLASLTPFGELDFNQSLWLSIEVDSEGEMQPRQRLSAVTYAITADTLDGLDASQLLRADVDTIAKGQLKLTHPGPALLIQPSTNPVANTKLLDVRDATGTTKFSVDLEGDISSAGSLAAHSATHQPGGSDALPTASAVSIGSANGEGTSTSLARADHLHQGVHALNASGQPQLVGDITLAAGSNIALTQAGQTITIAATAVDDDDNAVTSFASSAVSISTSSDTELLLVTITKSQASSPLLVLATVELKHKSGSDTKLIDVKLFRDATQLDSTYQARIGKGEGAVQELPVSLHAWDTSGAGTYTFTLKARSNKSGAEATIRRLTVIELL